MNKNKKAVKEKDNFWKWSIAFYSFVFITLIILFSTPINAQVDYFDIGAVTNTTQNNYALGIIIVPKENITLMNFTTGGGTATLCGVKINSPSRPYVFNSTLTTVGSDKVCVINTNLTKGVNYFVFQYAPSSVEQTLKSNADTSIFEFGAYYINRSCYAGTGWNSTITCNGGAVDNWYGVKTFTTQNITEGAPPPDVKFNISVTATDENIVSIPNFTLLINETYYTTTSGIVTTNVQNGTGTFNIGFFNGSNATTNFNNKTYLGNVFGQSNITLEDVEVFYPDYRFPIYVFAEDNESNTINNFTLLINETYYTTTTSQVLTNIYNTTSNFTISFYNGSTATMNYSNALFLNQPFSNNITLTGLTNYTAPTPIIHNKVFDVFVMNTENIILLLGLLIILIGLNIFLIITGQDTIMYVISMLMFALGFLLLFNDWNIIISLIVIIVPFLFLFWAKD